MFGGKEQFICGLAYSVVHWEPSEMSVALLGWLLLLLGHSWTSSFVLEVLVTSWGADRSQGKAQESTLALGMTRQSMCFLLLKCFFNLLFWWGGIQGVLGGSSATCNQVCLLCFRVNQARRVRRVTKVLM